MTASCRLFSKLCPEQKGRVDFFQQFLHLSNLSKASLCMLTHSPVKSSWYADCASAQHLGLASGSVCLCIPQI